MKLSELILAQIKSIIDGRGVTWEWVEVNTFFVKWWRMARELEEYIEVMPKGERSEV